MQRLPIFHDDHSFRDRTDRLFRDMQFQMDHDLMRGFGPGPSSSSSTTSSSRWSPLLQDPHGGFGPGGGGDDGFFQLKPRPVNTLQSSSLGDRRGSQEILDDATVRNLFVEDPQHKSRVFRMSFDVSSYDPKDIQVRVEDRCLVVEAKHSSDAGDAASSKYTKEFCRKIQLPADVEAEKLSSTLSTDGILSIQAAVPPTYQSLTSGTATDPGLLLGPTGQFPGPMRGSPITIQHQGSMLQNTMPPMTIQQVGFPTSTIQQHHQQQQQLRPVATGGGPVTIPVMSYPPAVNVGLDRPVFTTVEGGRRRMDLVLDLGHQYKAEDAVVKIDGRRLIVEATHEINDHGRVSKSSMQREFDLGEDVDPNTIQAMMKVKGQLAIVGFVRQ